MIDQWTDHMEETATDQTTYYIDRFLDLKEIELDMSTDPEIIAQVLKEDMLLFDYEPVQLLLKESLSQPVSLRPMLEATRKAIVEKQPAVYEFLKEAIEGGLITRVKDEASKKIYVRNLHHAYILNILTLEIVKNIDFVVDIQRYLIEVRSKYGIRTDFVDALEDLKKLYSGSMFEPSKIVGMDIVYRSRADIRLRKVITDKEIKAQQDGLKLNILEASVTDKKLGLDDNALVGAVLSRIQPLTVSLSEDEEKIMLFHLSRKWVSLYETWNLAFITGNLAYLHILYPKLLIPAVIGATHNEYLITRSAALWLSTLFHQFAALNRKPDQPIANKKELAKVWGKVNLKYANELAQEEGKELAYYKDALDISLSDIMEAMKHSITSVPLTKEDTQRLADIYKFD